MQDLISLAKTSANKYQRLPFSVYSSFKEQRILNAPIINPLLIFVMHGTKRLGKNDEIICPSGNFIFLSNTAHIDMRNTPETEYFAILIEFEQCNFQQFKNRKTSPKKYFQGKIDATLKKALHQYIEWSTFSPSQLWSHRKEEILHLLYLSGHRDVEAIMAHTSLSHKLHDIISRDISHHWNIDNLTARLAISESTLRRRLKSEGTGIKHVIHSVKLGHGLHLLQTTMDPIGRIAEFCGYPSQSHFSIKFKQLFGMTPTELRKTRTLN